MCCWRNLRYISEDEMFDNLQIPTAAMAVVTTPRCITNIDRAVFASETYEKGQRQI